MKDLLQKRIFAIMLSVLLVAGMSSTAFAASFGSDSDARIMADPSYVALKVGETKVVVVDYSEITGVDDINIYRATSSVYDPEIAKARFGNNNTDIFALEITGLAEGKTAVYVSVGKYSRSITVEVGKGKKASTPATQTSQTGPASSKTVLEKALDSAINKSTQKDVTVSTTSAKIPAIESATLKALANTAEQANKRAIVRIDSLNSKGKLQARLYLDPASLVNLKSDFKTGISVDTSRKALGSKYIASVKCAYTGGFGKYTEIAVKVNAPKDISKLSFYNVDSKGKFKKIDKPSCSLDKNGILHFFTKNGGEIVIVNGTI